MTWGQLASAVRPGARFTTTAVEPTPRDPAPPPEGTLGRLLYAESLPKMTRAMVLAVPAARQAHHVLCHTPATFDLGLWRRNERLEAEEPPWLRQPDPDETLFETLARTIDDLIWSDVAYWRVRDVYARDLRPASFERISASRVTAGVPNDPSSMWHTEDSRPSDYLIDGSKVDARELVVFRGSMLGGYARWGASVLDVALKLQSAAGRYADDPLPAFELHNTGADLTGEERDAMLTAWQEARQLRATAYTNAPIETKFYGWSSRELQLVEAREHVALEIARLFGLPARALNASYGDSMTYANVVELRRDLIEALRPWLTCIEQTLSLPQVTANLLEVRFDVDAYTRDDPAGRAAFYNAGISGGWLTIEEARAAEPLIATAALPSSAPAPAPGMP